MIKRFLTAAAFTIVAAAQLPLPPARVVLAWDYPTNALDGVTFRVYHGTNLSTPKTNWVVISTTTNLMATNLLVPGVHFFSVTACNLWGESDFSEVARTPAVITPGDLKNLRIRRE